MWLPAQCATTEWRKELSREMAKGRHSLTSSRLLGELLPAELLLDKAQEAYREAGFLDERSPCSYSGAHPAAILEQGMSYCKVQIEGVVLGAAQWS